MINDLRLCLAAPRHAPTSPVKIAATPAAGPAKRDAHTYVLFSMGGIPIYPDRRWPELLTWGRRNRRCGTGSLSNTPIISVVDDDDSMRAFLCSLVRSLGFKANAFASAEEFLQSSGLDDASCVISDVQMPNMNGIEL